MQATLGRRLNNAKNSTARFEIGVTTRAERETIYGLRYRVYSEELGQHLPNDGRKLSDKLDDNNVYLVAKCSGAVAGFISVTPPSAPSYSVDKYFRREECPFAFNQQLYEIRLLTVLKPHRGNELAMLLMYAAFRWVQARGGTHIAAIGRHE